MKCIYNVLNIIINKEYILANKIKVEEYILKFLKTIRKQLQLKFLKSEYVRSG